MTKNNCGVVLVNYHTTDDVMLIAKHYSKMDNIARIVIVNVDSCEQDEAILSEVNEDKVHIILEKNNLGYSKGNNLGIAYLNTIKEVENIIISNSDIVVEESTIVELLSYLEKNKEYAALAPRMIDSKGEVTPLRYVDLGYKRLFLMCFVNNFDSKCQQFLNEKDGIVQQSFLPGSFFVIRKKAINDCGLFDPNIFLYREEEILGQRLMNKGYKLGVINSLSYVHNHPYSRETLKKVNKNKLLEQRSERYYFKKYLNASFVQMVFVCFFQFLFLLRWDLRYLLKRGK